MTPDIIESKINDLLPRIRCIAFYLSNSSPCVDGDDLAQAGVEAVVIFLQGSNDQFSSDAYLLRHAKFKMLNLLRHDWVFLKYVDAEEAIFSTDSDSDNDFALWGDWLPGHDPNPEDVVVSRETARELVGSLNRTSLEVLKLLAAGFGESEAAEYLNITRSAVSQRKHTIAKYLRKITDFSYA